MILINIGTANPFPHVVEPEMADSWPNQDSINQFCKLVNAIINRGFKGMRPPRCEQPPSGYIYINYEYDKTSPEGRMFESLIFFCRAGKKLFSEKKAVEILERIYREQGRELPTKEGVNE